MMALEEETKQVLIVMTGLVLMTLIAVIGFGRWWH